MAFNFDKLWSLIAERNISKDTLRNKISASQTTIVSMGKNKNVSLDVIDRICRFLQCYPHEIMEYILEPPISEDFLDLKSGDVFILDFPGEKATPVVILQSEQAIKNHPVVWVLPLTTQLFSKPSDVIEIVGTKETGLPKTVFAMTSKIRPVQKQQLREKIGQISNKDLAKVKNGITRNFDIIN